MKGSYDQAKRTDLAVAPELIPVPTRSNAQMSGYIAVPLLYMSRLTILSTSLPDCELSSPRRPPPPSGPKQRDQIWLCFSTSLNPCPSCIHTIYYTTYTTNPKRIPAESIA